MYEKAGRYYADWRDTKGRRLRRSFKTKRAALQFEAEQKELAHPNRHAHGTQSQTTYAPRTSVRRRTQAPAPRKPQKRSSLALVHSRRTN